MAVNVSVHAHWWVSLRHDTVDTMLPPSGNPIECHEEVLSLQPMMPPERFEIFSPSRRCSEGLEATGCNPTRNAREVL